VGGLGSIPDHWRKYAALSPAYNPFLQATIAVRSTTGEACTVPQPFFLKDFDATIKHVLVLALGSSF
jgi:hypothetical protein